MTAFERTGWRDEWISRRHREWGYNCPAVDLDFLVVEYNIGEPVALVEYKHEAAQMADFHHPTYRALLSLSEAAGLPFMVVYYRKDPPRFLVIPANDRAQSTYGSWRSLSERHYVQSLYLMRKQTVDEHTLARLSQVHDLLSEWPIICNYPKDAMLA